MSKLGRNRGDKGYIYVTTKDGVRKKLDKRSDEYKRYVSQKQKPKSTPNITEVGVKDGLYTGGSATGKTQM